MAPNLRFTVSPPPPGMHIVFSQEVRQLVERRIYVSHSMDISRLHPLLIFVKATSCAGISLASGACAPQSRSSTSATSGIDRQPIYKSEGASLAGPTGLAPRPACPLQALSRSARPRSEPPGPPRVPDGLLLFRRRLPYDRGKAPGGRIKRVAGLRKGSPNHVAPGGGGT